MQRMNSKGIPFEDLVWTLKQKRLVLIARKEKSCLLCCAKKVNDAGLCDVCYSLLDGEELRLAERWMSGVGP